MKRFSYRENWLKTVFFKEPEYIMGGIWIRADGWHKYGTKLNDLYQKYFGYRPYSDDEIPHPDPKFINENDQYHRVWTDEWGCVMEEKIFGIHPMIVGHPFDDWSAFENYTPPPKAEMNPTAIENERGQIAKEKKEDKIVIKYFLRTFEQMQWLRGYEKLMIDFAEDSPELYKLADMILDINLSLINYAIAVDVDAVAFSDDWGTQNALMISPHKWREFFKPLYKKMFDPIKKAGKIVHFHSDGYIIDIIPDLKELGADVVNLQSNCHNLEQLGQVCHDLPLCISSDMDRQGVLSFGTPADVKSYFHKIAYHLGSRKGGLFFSCECGSDTPLANIEAAMQTLKEYEEMPLEKVAKKYIV